MWYSERMNPMGQWTPQLTPDRPTEKTESGTKQKLRNVHELGFEHLGMTLNQLSGFFNPPTPVSDPEPPPRKYALVWEKQTDHMWRATSRDGWYEANQHVYLDGTEGTWSCFYRSKLIADRFSTLQECIDFCDDHHKEFDT